MGIMSLIREQKDKMIAANVTRKSKNALYKAHPEAEMQDLKDEKARLQMKADIRAEKEKVKSMKREEMTSKFKAVSGFLSSPTVEKAKQSKNIKSATRQPSFKVEQNPAFGLGASEKNYSLQKPSVFGLGGAKRNDAFGLGPEKKRNEFGRTRSEQRRHNDENRSAQAYWLSQKKKRR
jgi:hypothetical protein